MGAPRVQGCHGGGEIRSTTSPRVRPRRALRPFLPPRPLAALAATLALVFAALAPRTALAEECEAWPGEFSPLPTVDSTDPFAAHWAQLRVRELSGLAAELEPSDRIEAHRLWQRILCLDPDDEAALAGIVRTEPQVVVQQSTLSEPTAKDDTPSSSPPEAPAANSGRIGGPPTLGSLDRDLARTQELIFDARFRDSLQAVDDVRRSLRGTVPAPEVRQRLAAFEILAATAWVALREDEEARASFERALAQDPALELDRSTTPPKVQRAFRATRSSLARGDG